MEERGCGRGAEAVGTGTGWEIKRTLYFLLLFFFVCTSCVIIELQAMRGVGGWTKRYHEGKPHLSVTAPILRQTGNSRSENR